MAGVKAGAVRELHWHKEAEWFYVLKGKARITAVDEMGRTFADDVGEGDLWYFPPGIPHSIQGLDSEVDGCEFLLVFDDGNFSEDSTFLLTDWLAHTPCDVLAKNFGASEDKLEKLPTKELYIFPAPKLGPLLDDRKSDAAPVPNTFSHRLLQQEPNREFRRSFDVVGRLGRRFQNWRPCSSKIATSPALGWGHLGPLLLLRRCASYAVCIGMVRRERGRSELRITRTILNLDRSVF